MKPYPLKWAPFKRRTMWQLVFVLSMWGVCLGRCLFSPYANTMDIIATVLLGLIPLSVLAICFLDWQIERTVNRSKEQVCKLSK